MPIRILAIGKKHETWVVSGIKRYEKRLQKPFNVSWIILPHSAHEGLLARQDESGRLLAKLGGHEFVILLDEQGTLFDSPTISKIFLSPLQSSQAVTVIIGGAYGVADALKRRANVVWSLSPLVFPHQLVRLILAEQLYRAQEIAANRPYHHD